MKSIYSNFTGLHENGAPIDFLATWKKAFDLASEREKNMFSDKIYSDKWCTYNPPQMSLTAEAVVGKYNIRFMATLIGNESGTPLRRSDGFDIWTHEIPRVGHKFPMMARDYRKLMEVYENKRISEPEKVKQIKKTLQADLQDAYLGCKDVMDFILLTAFSNWGVAKFEPEINNPGGRKFEIDYQMADANKLVSSYNWTTANTGAGKVSPINMLSTICAELRNKGVEPGEILMSQDLYFWLRMDESTRLLAHGSDKKAQTVTKSELESVLAENEIPAITVITKKMAIDKDGKRSTIDPWNHNFIAIKPAGVIGEIQPSVEDSELMEEENVDYFNPGSGIRIAKWCTGESTGQTAAEYTQGSGRLLPLINEINQIVCLQVRGIEEHPADGKAYQTKTEYDAKAALAMG